MLNFLPAIIGPLNLLESIALVKSKMYLKHLMSSVLKIFYHLLSVSALPIPQEHEKMENGLSMEYNEVSMLHPPTKNKGRHNFKYLEFSYWHFLKTWVLSSSTFSQLNFTFHFYWQESVSISVVRKEQFGKV